MQNWENSLRSSDLFEFLKREAICTYCLIGEMAFSVHFISPKSEKFSILTRVSNKVGESGEDDETVECL